MEERKQLAVESEKKKVINKVKKLANSNTLSIQPITPPCSQVKELLQSPTVVLKSKLPAKWIRKVQNRTARQVGRPSGKLEAAQEAHVLNVCNQIQNRKKNAIRLLRQNDRSNVGAKVKTRVDAFENAADALLMEISKMLSDSLNDISASGHTHAFDTSIPLVQFLCITPHTMISGLY